MKILVLNKGEFAKSDIVFLGMLEENGDFEKLIVDIRKKHGLPTEGYILDLTPEGKFASASFDQKVSEDIEKAERWVRTPIRDVIHAFNLPLYWQNTVYSIILFNLAIPPMRFDEWYKPVEIRYQGSLDGLLHRVKGNFDHPNETEPHLTIVVREKMSFAQLMAELKNQKGEVKKYLSYLDATPAPDFKNYEVRKEMHDLKKAGKSGQEIATILNDKYGAGNELGYTPDKDQINKYNKRFEQFINDMSSRFFDTYFGKYLD